MMLSRVPWLGAWLAGLLLLAAGTTARARQPNIVIILADDLGYADLGCQGSRDIKTPNIDALAAHGVRCTNGYAAAPVGGPTRAALLTGRYPQRFGQEFNPPRDPKAEYGLPLTETTLASSLRAAGYATGLIGKWHMGSDPNRHPQARGFQEFFGFLDGAHYYVGSHAPPGGHMPDLGPWPSGILRGTQPVAEKDYLTDAFTREAVAFIEIHQKQPFFLFLSYNAPHVPLEASGTHLSRVIGVTGGDHRRRVYAAMIAAMDDGVGAVQTKLKETGVFEDTLIFFLSDNGGITGYFSPSSNAPLVGAKTELLEGGIRVPMLVQWPGKLPAGTLYEPMASVLDVAPTVLAAAEARAPDGRVLDGVDLTPHLTGKRADPPHSELFWRYGPLGAVRSGRYKLLRVRDEPLQLFDLQTDIGETRDLAPGHPEIVKPLRERWDRWKSELVPPAWSHPNLPPWL
jgi:arylsulfatase A-like enzyme